MDQLRDPQVSFGVKQRRPHKLSEAVAATTELESCLPWTNQISQISQPEKSPIADQTIAAIQSTQKDLFGVVQKLVERVKQLEQRPRINPQRQPQRLLQSSSRGVVTCACLRCGKEGNYARGCAMPGRRANLPPTQDTLTHLNSFHIQFPLTMCQVMCYHVV